MPDKICVRIHDLSLINLTHRMSECTTGDETLQVIGFYQSIKPSVTNPKLLRYFSCKESTISKSSNQLVTMCHFCHEHNINKLEVRLISKKKNHTRCTHLFKPKKGCNTLSLSCKTCGRISLSNAIDRTFCAPAYNSVNTTPKNSQSKDMCSQKENNSSKKRPRKSISKLQQQLQKSRANKTSNEKITNVSFTDFLSL